MMRTELINEFSLLPEGADPSVWAIILVVLTFE